MSKVPKVYDNKSVSKVKKGNGFKNPKLTQESINSKLDGYLLNKEHPVGGSKTNWFEKALGFNKNNSQQLSKQIMFDKSTAVQTAVTDYGTKYSIVKSFQSKESTEKLLMLNLFG